MDRRVDLSEVRRDLAPFYSSLGRPSVDPELLIRMLIVGYLRRRPLRAAALRRGPLNLAYMVLPARARRQCPRSFHHLEEPAQPYAGLGGTCEPYTPAP
jgi:hypothetical protein